MCNSEHARTTLYTDRHTHEDDVLLPREEIIKKKQSQVRRYDIRNIWTIYEFA